MHLGSINHMKKGLWLILAVLCSTLNVIGQESQTDAPSKPILGNSVAESLAALSSAELANNTEILLLGLESQFLLVRKNAALALSKRSHPDALQQLVNAYDANQAYAVGGSESEFLRRDINVALVVAMDRAMDGARADHGQYSERETSMIIEEAKRRLSRNADPGGQAAASGVTSASAALVRHSQPALSPRTPVSESKTVETTSQPDTTPKWIWPWGVSAILLILVVAIRLVQRR